VHAATAAGPVTVVRDTGFPSVVTEADADGVTVRLELDDAGNHPYRPYARCYPRYSARNPRDERDGTPRRVGERAEHVAEIRLGDGVPLRAQRLPAGRRAAVVFTSHADQSTVATTQAVLWGASDPADPAFGTRGLLGHGLTPTLVAFAEAGTHADLGDPAFREVLERAAAAGVEVGPHSVTSRADDRATVARLLPRFAGFAPATWIDHQPDTNCEAVMNAGGRPERDPAWFDLDLLRDAGLRYLWTEPDVDPPDGGLDMLAPGRAGYRPTILFRNAHVRDGAWVPWLFRTVWLFVDVPRLTARFDDASVQRLIAEDGILLAHVYLDTYQRTGRFAPRSLVEPSGDGFRLRDDVDDVFRRLGEAQRAGLLWVPTMRALGDQLTGVAELRLESAPDGSVVVRGGDRDLDDVAFAVPDAGATITVDGGAPDGTVPRDGQTVFWFDLPARTARTLRLTRDGTEVRFAPAGSTVVAP
jgi:hypothetical protein